MNSKGDDTTFATRETRDASFGAESKPQGLATTIAQDEDHSDVEEVTVGAYSDSMDRIIRKSEMRAKQAVRWNLELHLRMQKLEKDFARLTGEDILQGGDFSSAKGPNHEPSIKRMTWDEFKPPRAPLTLSDAPNEKHNLRLDTRKRWVLEVLEREPEQTERSQGDKPGAQSGKMAAGKESAEGESQQYEHSTSFGASSKAPARLRIRSSAILAHLNDMSKDELNLKPGKMTFLRPFKFFCIYEAEIRARHAQLEAKYARDLDSSDDEAKQNLEKLERSQRSASKASLDNADIGHGERESPKALQHFRLLIKFLDEDLKPLLDFRRALGRNEVKKIAFEELWHLFKHDQEVLVPGPEKEKAGIYRVFKFTGGRHTFQSNYGPPIHPISKDLGPGSWSRAFGVQCWGLRFDGNVYRPQLKTFGIRPYEGEKDITSLPVYPLAHEPAHEDIRKRYVASGRTYMSYCQKDAVYRRYTGPNLDEGSRGEHINSEVVVDFEEAYIHGYERPVAIDFEEDVISNDYRELDEIVSGNTHCKEDGCCTSDVFHQDYDIDNDLREKHYKHGYDSPLLEARSDIDKDDECMLLPSQLFGFILKKQRWATLSIATNCLKDVESLNFWKDLVLERRTKDLVEAQVNQHLQRAEEEKKEGNSANFGEFISGKGRSLVILLHGPPGVGKTSTAECIADHVKKPLYSLTSGNLGVSPDTVEQKLENHFNLAAKWGCILLLDEADVFLQQRKHTQLNINAIVSIFLRQLEYYTGVLFLTTNRLGDIDRAFKSRIHVALEYKRFNRSTSMKVYRLCLSRLHTQYDSRGRKLKIREEEILDWAKKNFKENHWNGREIFNSCQTAIALAEWEFKTKVSKKLVLKEKHFERVAEASRGFERYLNDLRDEEDKEAWRLRTRIDDESFRGRAPQGSFLATPTPPAKKKLRKVSSEDDSEEEDDTDGSDNEKKSVNRGKGKNESTDDDSSGTE